MTTSNISSHLAEAWHLQRNDVEDGWWALEIDPGLWIHLRTLFAALHESKHRGYSIAVVRPVTTDGRWLGTARQYTYDSDARYGGWFRLVDIDDSVPFDSNEGNRS